MIHPLTGEESEDIALNGFIDLIVAGADGSYCVIDLKTVARKPREGMARVALELSLYAYLMSLPFTGPEFDPVQVALLYLVRTKTQQVIWDEGRRSLPHYVELYRICVNVAQDIQEGNFWKNPGMHCGWCDFQTLCYAEEENAIQLFGEEMWALYQRDKLDREVVNEAAVVNF